MSSVVVGGLPIRVAPGSIKTDRDDGVDRARRFDQSYSASKTGGTARDFHFTTPPVSATDFAAYMAVLSQTQAQTCSGDIITIPTMCCAETHGWSPVRSQGATYYTIDFTLHESQSDKVLLKYSPGDTITGESFTRSTTAYQIDSGGKPVSVAINTKRDNHNIGGVRSLLLEDTRTNNLIWANDFNNGAWVKTTCAITIGIADPSGGTSACTLTATGASSHCIQTLAAGASAVRTNSAWIRRRTGTGSVFLRDSLNTGFVDVGALISGTWQRFSITSAAGTARILDVQIGTSGDAVDVWCAQNEEGAFMSSEIPTTTVALTRGADTYALPFTTPPQEMTADAKFVERGTFLTSARVFEIGNAAGANPKFTVVALPFYEAFHNNGSVTAASTVAVGPAIGDLVELVPRLFGDGSDQIEQSLNGAASTSSTQSAANALATAWAGQLLYLNSIGTTGGGVGFTALQSFKIVAGARSLSEMRAL